MPEVTWLVQLDGSSLSFNNKGNNSASLFTAMGLEYSSLDLERRCQCSVLRGELIQRQANGLDDFEPNPEDQAVNLHYSS